MQMQEGQAGKGSGLFASGGVQLLQEQQLYVHRDNMAFRKEICDYDERQKVKKAKHVRMPNRPLLFWEVFLTITCTCACCRSIGRTSPRGKEGAQRRREVEKPHKSPLPRMSAVLNTCR